MSAANQDMVTPKKGKICQNFIGSSPVSDAMYPWNWPDEARKVELSPSGSYVSCSSPESDSKNRGDNTRRGRPRLDTLTSLILEGSSSRSQIKCQVCNRVFPREKSLQAHMRTHTGERPYLCDYPGCEKSFAQSGQLKTHQRLHTGEKPFICTFAGCTSRFTHANRHCTAHPDAVLMRDDQYAGGVGNIENKSEDVVQWLEKYKKERNCSPNAPKKCKKEVSNTNIKRARLDMSAADDSESTEVREKLMGALALIQLAESSKLQQKSCLLSDDSQYPLDLSSHKLC